MKKLALALATAAMCGTMAISFAACGAKGPSGDTYDKARDYESQQITEEQWNAVKEYFESKDDLVYALDHYSYTDIKAELTSPKKLSTRYQEEITSHYVCSQSKAFNNRIEYEKRTNKLTYTGKYAEYRNITLHESGIPKSGSEATAERYTKGPRGREGSRSTIMLYGDEWREVKDQLTKTILPSPIVSDASFSRLSYSAKDKGYVCSILGGFSIVYKFDENGRLAAAIETTPQSYDLGNDKHTGDKIEAYLFTYDVESVDLPTGYIPA